MVTINSLGLSQYKSADRFITFNDGDEALKPIIYELPLPPTLSTIDGFGLPPEEQYFKRPKIPEKLKEIQKENITDNQKALRLEANPDYYQEEIDFIRLHWERADNGYWFFNLGKPTYITNYHYLFLCNWHIQNPDSPLPFFCMYDREAFLFIEMCINDIFCLGMNWPKHRRAGATSIVTSLRFFRAVTHILHHSALQSMTEESAVKIHFNHLLYGWDRMDFWMRPIYEGDSRKTKELRFYSPRFKSSPDFGTAAIESRISYGASSETYYDGDVVNDIHNDETGKCFSKGTPVLMHNGSVKNVEDVVVGDVLMGDDSTPRKVLSLARGQEEMFLVQPKKGMAWGCNESHILSLKWCKGAFPFRGIKKNETINISVLDFLTIGSGNQKHLMLYRTGVEYSEQQHKIPPYLLGIWLGDGNAHDTGITKPDSEILDYLKEYASNNAIHVRTSTKNNKSGNTCPTHHITTGIIASKNNTFLNALNHYKLIKNKHIPNEFLTDSRSNRLELLAGLLDTDGYKQSGSKKRGYEIVQKSKLIAEGIYTLATGLGFYCGVKERIATMKRNDGTLYSCVVYRIGIYGNDLHNIPCKIERKKQTRVENPHKNTRNPLRSGFKIIPQGIGDYFGFVIDGNHLFQLSDGTVVHNTVEANVYNRHGVIRPALMRGTRIIGKEWNTSTVEEMLQKGGANFKKLCDESDYYKKDPTTQMTTSGLYTLFIPAHEKLDGKNPVTKQNWIDKYGFCDPSAKDYILATAAQFERDGNTEEWANTLRRYPLCYRDCWRPATKGSPWNLSIINRRRDLLSSYSPPLSTRVAFEWIVGQEGSAALMRPDPEGHFTISWNFEKPEFANARFFDEQKNLWCPGNTHLFVAGCDNFSHRNTQGSRKSFAAFAIKYKFDFSVDNPMSDKALWKSDRFICTYVHRTPTPEDAAEEWMMACCYFGCELFPETNLPLTQDYFKDNGYGGYLYYEIKDTGKVEINAGDKTDMFVKELMFARWQTYVERCGVRDCHDEILEELQNISHPDDMKDHDLFTAAGYALLGEYKQVSQANPHLRGYKPTEILGDALDEVIEAYDVE